MSTKQKLSIRIERWGRSIIYQVLHQDESLRGNCDFTASNGIRIRSRKSPEVEEERLYIRGTYEASDNTIATYNLESELLAEEFRLKILQAVEEFNSQVDWSKVPVNTKVLVSDDGEDWHKRYFSDYENGKYYCFLEGGTSWSSDGISIWKYCKLAEQTILMYKRKQQAFDDSEMTDYKYLQVAIPKFIQELHEANNKQKYSLDLRLLTVDNLLQHYSQIVGNADKYIEVLQKEGWF